MKAAAKHVRTGLAAALVTTVLAACAAPASPPVSAATGAPPPRSAEGSGAGSAVSADSSGKQPSAQGPTPVPASPDGSAIHARAGEVDRFEAELIQAGSDCREACRALGSMDRACGGLCSLSRGTSEAPLCSTATKRLLAARDTVKRACGACPNGPSVERFAPVPSVD